jgi:3-isopropylmalate dehydrogenase
LLSAAMLLEHFDLFQEAESIHNAVQKSLETNIVTPDLNVVRNFSTDYVGDYISNTILNYDPNLSFQNQENISLGKSVII